MTDASHKGQKIRCAIYTRKSTEEGLEQDFNTLDAQREACEAYVMSQIHEGWEVLSDLYDDGGYSGGSMERPALKQLMIDIEEGKVDVVVVYKVDRLTRSLADFAKIVEILDDREASFVSVTQAFNTTTSMGRLTLNVLLSFAQFEREVTGERIRDKIAASKKKGMWMGGPLALGYDVKDRKLIINSKEAETVRHIFRSYLEIGSVDTLVSTLKAQGVCSKVKTSKAGRVTGGLPISRGALYHMLQNPIYIGRIRHKQESHQGEHEAIIDSELWEAVQTLLKQNRQTRRVQSNSKEPSLLAGLIKDENGMALTPSHASKGGKRYRYYVGIKNPDETAKAARIPAGEIEELVLNRLRKLLMSPAELHHALTPFQLSAEDFVHLNQLAVQNPLACGDTKQAELHRSLQDLQPQCIISKYQVKIAIAPAYLLKVLSPALLRGMDLPELSTYLIKVDATLKRTGIGTKLKIEGQANGPDPALQRLLAKAHLVKEHLVTSEAPTLYEAAEELGMVRTYAIRIFRLNLLAPDIVKAILQGKQPPELTARKLMRDTRFPLDWNEQRRQLGFGPMNST